MEAIAKNRSSGGQSTIDDNSSSNALQSVKSDSTLQFFHVMEELQR